MTPMQRFNEAVEQCDSILGDNYDTLSPEELYSELRVSFPVQAGELLDAAQPLGYFGKYVVDATATL